MPVWPKQTDRSAFYGIPYMDRFKLNPSLETAHLVRVQFPWRPKADGMHFQVARV